MATLFATMLRSAFTVNKCYSQHVLNAQSHPRVAMYCSELMMTNERLLRTMSSQIHSKNSIIDQLRGEITVPWLTMNFCSYGNILKVGGSLNKELKTPSRIEMGKDLFMGT